MNDSCTISRRLLSEQSDRTLTTDELTGLRAHLATCPGCRAFERDLQAGLAGIARLPRISGSSAVREAVLAGVHPGGRSAWPRGWRGWTGQTLKLAGAIGAFALVAVILMTVFSGSGEPDERLSGAGAQHRPFVEPTATPEPEATIPATADVYAPLLCTGAQVSFEITVDSNPGDPTMTPISPSFVGVTAQALKGSGGVECRLRTPITLTIQDDAGTPLDIEGNGLTVPLDVIVPDDGARVDFAWLNWCDPVGRVTFEVDLANWGIMFTQNTPGIVPACDDPNRPSTVGQMGFAEVMPTATPAATTPDTSPTPTSASEPAVEPTTPPTATPLTTPTAVPPMTATATPADEPVMPAETPTPTSLPVCAPDQYALLLQPPTVATGSVYYRVEAVSQAVPCRLDAGLTITFLGADGQPLPFDGNGMTLPLAGDLPDEAVVTGVIWANWCGEREALRVEIATPDHIFQSDQVAAPGCNGPGQPTILQPIPDADL